MALLDYVGGKTEGIACAGVVQINDKVVEIYGEIHGSSNPFYEGLLDGGLVGDYEVLCEMTPASCRYYRSLCANARRRTTGLPHLVAHLSRAPVCVDIRDAHHLPSGSEERAYQQLFAQRSCSALAASSVATVADRMQQARATLRGSHARFTRAFGSAYEQLTRAIDRELAIVQALVRLGSYFIHRHWDALCCVGTALTRNVQKACGALVDLHVESLLHSSTSRRIAVFTGAAHAFRLIDLVFRDAGRFVVDPSDDLMVELLFWPEGDDELEQVLMRALHRT